MLRVTLKGLLAHKLRLALTAVSVLLAVSFVSGTFVLTDTMRHTFDAFFTSVNAGTDVSVRTRSGLGDSGPHRGPAGADRMPVPTELVETLRRVEGVEAAEGTLVGYAQIAEGNTGEGAAAGPAIGTAWVDSAALNPLVLRAGREPRAGDEVVIDAGTARTRHLGVGDRVRIVSQVAPGHFTVVGVTGFGPADSLAGATLASFDDRTARRVLVRPDGFDTIEVAARDGVTQADLRRRVARVLPPGLEAVTGEVAAKESAEQVQDDLGFFGTLLLVFAGVSLFVAAFIILNTFQVLVAQRTRELGLLRALGASAAQVRGAVLAEAAVVGALASGAGLGLGVVVAMALQDLLRRFGVDLPGAAVQFLPRTAVVSLVAGLAVTVVSAALPARRAARVAPMAALAQDLTRDVAGSLRRRTLAGLVVSAVGFALLLAGTSGAGNAAATVGVGAVVGFVGASLVAPAVTGPLARLAGAPLARLGFSGKLGRENAIRNPRRTAATAAALMVGLALVTLVTVFAASARTSTNRVIDEAFGADLVLTAGPDSAGFSPEAARRVRRLPGVRAAAEFRQGGWRHRGHDEFLTATDPTGLDEVLDLGVTSGAVANLEDGGLLVHADEARAERLEVGDVVTMTFSRTGRQQVRVDGIFTSNQLTGDYVLSLRDFEANFTDQLDAFAMVKLEAGASPTAARRAIAAAVRDFAGVEVRDQDEFKQEVAGQVDRILNLFYALLALAVLIAVLGIVNTLALSVFERTRELGLLRVVGTSRRQMRTMVEVEGAIIAVLGAVLGLGIGIVVAAAMLQALRDKGLTDTAVPVARLLGFVALSGVAGLAAAVLPARRAARLDVLRAIAHE